jgi:hypothetical protein
MMAETEAQTKMEIVIVNDCDEYNDGCKDNNYNNNGDSNDKNNNGEGDGGLGSPLSFISSPSPIRLKMHMAAIAATTTTTTTTTNNNNYKPKNICALFYLSLHILLIACLLATQIFGVYVLFVVGLNTDSSIVILTHLVLLPLIPLGLAFIVAPLKSRRAVLVAVRIILFLYWALFAASLVIMFISAYKDGENEEVSFDLMLSQFLFTAIDFVSGILFTVGWAYGDYYS